MILDALSAALRADSVDVKLGGFLSPLSSQTGGNGSSVGKIISLWEELFFFLIQTLKRLPLAGYGVYMYMCT